MFDNALSGVINFLAGDGGTLITIVCIISIFAVGFLLVYPNERGRQWAKDSVLYVLIGVGVGLGAVQIAEGLVGYF